MNQSNSLGKSGDITAKKPHVLIIDDERDAVELLSLILTKNGFTADKSYKADDARSLLDTADTLPDIIILDVKLPGTDGVNFCKELQKTPRYQHIPVILVSAMCFESDIERGFAAGAKDYILKPWSNIDLVERIKHHLIINKS
ncbi:MAG: response regulator [Candidatus Heimdallarchaeota archaeon]|nr:response regulator [Candidatus Heimdallarchaeota archaeon]